MKPSHKALARALLGLALLGVVLALADPARVAAQLRHAHVGWLLAGLALAIASNAVSALRWRALARWLGADMGLRDAGRWYFQAIGLNALLPGAVVGGDVYRALALRRTGQDGAAASWSVLLDRLSGLWMLAVLAALPVSVGGWGTREAAAVAALTPFGVAAPAAVGAAVLYGLYGLAQGALGALAFGLPRRDQP